MIKMLSQKLLICEKCKSENIVAYQIIQTSNQLIINYRCVDCGNKGEIKLDISELEFFLEGLSNIFFRCYKCGGPVIISEKKDNGRATIVVYQCVNKGKKGKKKISSALYHDLRTLYLSKNNKKAQQNITISLMDKDTMVECPHCKSKIKACSYFCSYCGSDLRKAKIGTVICSECGAKNKKEANFCTRCGNTLKRVAKALDFEDSDDPFKGYVDCHFCGASVPDKNICPACGAKLRCDCGKLYKTGAKYCHSCGSKIPLPVEEEQEPKYVECPECGERVEIGFSFCTGCGANMEGIEPINGKNGNGKEGTK
jgi:DNA-directed RNA polymerase subunit RPC12/RpoP/ribosomal protein L40E